LGDLCASPSAGQIEIWFGGAVVVQVTVKDGSLEFSGVVSDVIWFYAKFFQPEPGANEIPVDGEAIVPYSGQQFAPHCSFSQFWR